MKNDPVKKQIISRGLKSLSKIYLPEIHDERIIAAIDELRRMGFSIASPLDLKPKFQIYYNLISKKKFTLNWTQKMKEDFLSVNLNYGLVALENGDIDCLVAGASCSTSEVLRSSLRIIGLNKKSKWVSSIFFMISPDEKNVFTFSDAGVIPDPNSKQLCDIAYHASNFHKLLSNQEPKVAFLSFSTKGSAEHYKVKKVQEAVRIFNKKNPHIVHDGEIQFDAAIDVNISRRKLDNSKLNGDANVFVFPDLDSANIGYKLTQYLANYQALGPLLQGLNKPVHDLSRGCCIDDIIHVSSIAAIQAQHAKL